MTFWDLCAPIYDLVERANGQAYRGMVQAVKDAIPQGATVLEAGAGTGAISIALWDKASSILMTDISDNMLSIARRKARKYPHITAEKKSIYNLGDKQYDVVVAAQVLHLLDKPEDAAKALRACARDLVILPIALTAELQGFSKAMVGVYRLFGFRPKREFDKESYAGFLGEIGFYGCRLVEVSGRIPAVVAVWGKGEGTISLPNVPQH